MHKCPSLTDYISHIRNHYNRAYLSLRSGWNRGITEYVGCGNRLAVRYVIGRHDVKRAILDPFEDQSAWIWPILWICSDLFSCRQDMLNVMLSDGLLEQMA